MKIPQTHAKKIVLALIKIMDGQDSYELQRITGLNSEELSQVYAAYRVARHLEDLGALD